MITVRSFFMMKPFKVTSKIILATAFLFLFSSCATTSSFSHIDEIDNEIPAAPDIHGANGNQIRPFSLRGNANLSITQRDVISINGLKNERKQCKIGNCDSDTLLGRSDYATAYYKSNSVYGNGGFDGLVSIHPLLFGFGIQYNSGFYSHISLGLNTKHFELGGHFGLWTMHRYQAYSGERYTCSPGPKYNKYTLSEDYFKESSNFAFTPTYGGYTSIYNGPLFITYSLNIYKPKIDVDADDADFLEGSNIDLPYVLTHHISVGYRFLKFLEYHVGVTKINGDFESPNPEFNMGISMYML